MKDSRDTRLKAVDDTVPTFCIYHVTMKDSRDTRLKAPSPPAHKGTHGDVTMKDSRDTRLKEKICAYQCDTIIGLQ